MPQAKRESVLLFWLMFLTGGAALSASLILPPWLEYQALVQLHSRTEHRLTILETRLRTVTKQIEHLRNDEAYIERLGRKELGLTTPGVETIPLQRIEQVETQPVAAAEFSEDDVMPELSTLVTEAVQRYPVASVFVLDQTRPIVMVLSGVLILAAIVLLWRPHAVAKR